MSAAIDPIGVAFPKELQPTHLINGDISMISMRDWFAGQALDGYLSGRNNTRGENPMNFEASRAAADCYRYADAMLAARKGGAQ